MPKTVLNKVQALISSFLNYRIWPTFAKDTLQLHRHQGGISLLDLGAQLKSLQWRWLRPLLENRDNPSSSQFSATNYIRYCLQLYCRCQDIRLPPHFQRNEAIYMVQPLEPSHQSISRHGKSRSSNSILLWPIPNFGQLRYMLTVTS
jgi:hypothetical protein